MSVRGGASIYEDPAELQNMKVVWAVPTNIWPPSYKIWTYKVIPQEFSPTIISNMMALGPFTAKDQIKTPAFMLQVDKKAAYFGIMGIKYLEILPTLGYLKYHDEYAQAKMVSAIRHVPEPVVGVPNQEETLKLGLKYVRLAGIEVSQLARKPGTDDLDLHWDIGSRGWFDTNRNYINETNNYGVFFDRCIDGIPISMCGDIFVSFGNNAKVMDLEVSWPNLQPYQLLDNFVTPEQVVKSIKSGQTQLPLLHDWPLDEIKTMTITNASPRYKRNYGDEPMDYVTPVLQLDAIIDNGKTNRYVWFQTDIFPPGTKKNHTLP
ncbi:MAG: hypothetical protein ACREFE_18625 [Limisphaerales bacterium]